MGVRKFWGDYSMKSGFVQWANNQGWTKTEDVEILGTSRMIREPLRTGLPQLKHFTD
jgi:hypothetical protein